MLTSAEERALASAVQFSGLGSGAMLPHLLADLLAAAETSETAAARTLNAPTQARPQT